MTDDNKKTGDYETKKSNRFYVTLPEDFNLPPFTIKSASLPSYNQGKWGSLDIVFYDLIGPSASQALFSLINRFPYTKYGDNPSHKNSEKKIIFEYTISSLDPVGIEVEKWKIFVANIDYVNFGHLNSDCEYIKSCHMQIDPHSCKLLF